MGRGRFDEGCDPLLLNSASTVGAVKGREARFWRNLSLTRRGTDPAGEATRHNHEAAAALTKLTRKDLERYEAEKAAAAAAAKTDGESEEEEHVPIPRSRIFMVVGEARLPKVGEPVMVEVVRFADTGVEVALLEYDNRPGFICYSQFYPHRMRSASSFIKVLNKEPAIVVRVDVDSGYVDLSNRLITDEVAAACQEKYKQNKFVHSALVHVARTLATDLEMLYDLIAWPLRRRFGTAFEGFMLIAADPNILDDLIYKEGAGPDVQQTFLQEAFPGLSTEIKSALVSEIKRRLYARQFKMRVEVEMKCFQADGVLHIKEAMKKAEAVGTNDCSVKAKLIAAPLYAFSTRTHEKEMGVSTLLSAVKAAADFIKSHKGKLVMKGSPKFVREGSFMRFSG